MFTPHHHSLDQCISLCCPMSNGDSRLVVIVVGVEVGWDGEPWGRGEEKNCISSRKPASLEAGLEVPFTRPKGVRVGPHQSPPIEVFFSFFQGVIFRSLF